MANLHEHPKVRRARAKLAQLGNGGFMYCPLPPLAQDLQDALGMIPAEPRAIPEARDYDPTGVCDPLVGTAFVRPAPQARETEGERRLLIAILMEAIDDSRAGDHGAQAWLRSSTGPFSARYCCDHTGVDYAWLMERVVPTWPEGSPHRSVAS